MKKIREVKFVAFDFEATYSKPIVLHEIIEIGAHKLEPETLNILTSFETLVRPSFRIISAIKQKTGITDEMVREAKPITDIWDEFVTFLGNATLVGYRVSFDIKLLEKTSDYYGLNPISNPSIDVFRLVKRLYPKEISYSLEHFQKLLGITTETHRATSDAYVTALLFKHLVEILEDKYGISEYHKLLNFYSNKQPRGGPQQLELF